MLWSEETFRIFEHDSTIAPTMEAALQRVHPDDAVRVKQTIEDAPHAAGSRVGSGSTDVDCEFRLLTPKAGIKHVRVVARAVRDELGGIELVGTVMDITATKRVEEALREQARLLDLTHDTVFVRDMRDVITYWNRGAEELYGWSQAEALDKVSHELTQTIFPRPLTDINAELLGTGRWEGELLHRTRDGRQVVVASRWSLQRDEKGRPTAILETNNDITERKRAEAELRDAQANLAHVSRVTTLGEMAASIAHEVDQPLSGVVINANACVRFLKGPSPNLDEVRDGLAAIARDGRRASEVIARIRALARRTSTDKQPMDINEVIREVAALAEAEAQRTQARVRMELAPRLPRVLGDQVQLQQVVLNLLLNGLDSMSAVAERPRELVITTRSEAADRVRVSVRDSGSGIDPQVANRLFEAFYTTKRHGLGMGLSISRSIVEQHGGRLWAEPNEGPGTTFHFTV
jgi:two-component system, LuxR family, sensor kinase FixL